MLSRLAYYIPYLFIGIAVAIPPTLIIVIDIWLSSSGVSKTVIGYFSIVQIPYTIKFIFVPFIEGIKFRKAKITKKRWVVLMQICIFFTVLGMSVCEPTPITLFPVFFLTLIFMILVGVQNILAYNFQVDTDDKKELGYISAYTSFGYRIGMVICTSTMLKMSVSFGWNLSFKIFALVLLLSGLVFLFRREPVVNNQVEAVKEKTIIDKLFLFNKNNIWSEYFFIPIMEIIKKKAMLWSLLIIAIIKIPDEMAHKMGKLMYLEIGFSRIDIAHYVEMFGMAATMIGALFGGRFLVKYGLFKTLTTTAMVHATTFLLYILVYSKGPNIQLLATSIAIENITGGAFMTVFLNYLYMRSGMSTVPSLVYAVLWCLYNILKMPMILLSGKMADTFGWTVFFILIFIISSVGTIIAMRNEKTFKVL